MKIYGFYIDSRLTVLDFDEFVFLCLSERIPNLHTAICMGAKKFFPHGRLTVVVGNYYIHS